MNKVAPLALAKVAKMGFSADEDFIFKVSYLFPSLQADINKAL